MELAEKTNFIEQLETITPLTVQETEEDAEGQVFRMGRHAEETETEEVEGHVFRMGRH